MRVKKIVEMLKRISVCNRAQLRILHQWSQRKEILSQSKSIGTDKVLLLPRRSFLDFLGVGTTRRTLPGQGLKKKTVQDITKEEKNSAVLSWMNKQKKEQEDAKEKKGRRFPDGKFFRRFVVKYLLVAVVISLTYQDLVELFEAAFDEPEFIASVSLSPSQSETPMVTCYRLLPLRMVSRIWGRITDLELPKFLLVPLLEQYNKLFNVNMEEAIFEDLSIYKNVSQFFRRPLKPHLRPICEQSTVVSPADGTVLVAGQIQGGIVNEIKYLSYTLPKFLGPLVFRPEALQQSLDKKQTVLTPPLDYQKLLLDDPEHNELYYCVVYLSPGDCHRYFSPVEWRMKHRRHFPGELLSVSPQVVKNVPELFSINERVILSGKWEHGFFAMCPVGATNVGSIKIYEDLTLMTNRVRYEKGSYYDFQFGEEGYSMAKGEEIGEFNMGSSIVLIFEAPKNTKLNLKPGQLVKYGEGLIDTHISTED